METIFITEKELAMNPDLLLAMGYEKEDLPEIEENLSIPDYLSLDPDYFNFGNWINGIYKIPCEEFVHDNVRYILIPDHFSPEYYYITNYKTEKSYEITINKAKKMLERFYSDEHKKYFTSPDNLVSWNDFAGLHCGVAYRGGSGYAYGLNKYHVNGVK